MVRRRLPSQGGAATEVSDATQAAAHFLKRFKRRRNITSKKCKVTTMTLREEQESLRKWHYRLMRVVRDATEPFCAEYNMD